MGSRSLGFRAGVVGEAMTLVPSRFRFDMHGLKVGACLGLPCFNALQFLTGLKAGMCSGPCFNALSFS